MAHSEYDLQILLPIHNEAGSIERTIREIHAEISPKVRMQFILCEDGSTDNTKEILRRIGDQIPSKLLLSDERKGYSGAVRDGMAISDAEYLLCLDSDGQCNPADFWQFWESRGEADVHIGWRVRRADNALRRLMSWSFHLIWHSLYALPIHDPSCPFMLSRRAVIQKLVPQLGLMKQGFWWEFMARVHRSGYSVREHPVKHRERTAGTTQVYHLRKLPGIGYRHLVALFQIWAETRPNRVLALQTASSEPASEAVTAQLLRLGNELDNSLLAVAAPMISQKSSKS